MNRNRYILGLIAVTTLLLSACDTGSTPNDVGSNRPTDCTTGCGTSGESSGTLPSAKQRSSSPKTSESHSRKSTVPQQPGTPKRPNSASVPRPGGTLTYSVTSDAKGIASITYAGNSGQVDLTNIHGGSWTKKISNSTVNYRVLIAVTDGTGNYISCSIKQDGKILVKNRSTGKAKGVNCQI